MLGRTATITRFHADPSDLRFDPVQAQAHHHLPVPVRPSKKTIRAGWCHPTNPLLPPSPASCKYEPWWHVGLRIDTWDAPAARLKHELDVLKRRWLEQMGRDRVPKPILEELREQIYPGLAVRTTRHVEVVVHTTTGEIWLESATASVQAIFELLCKRTWGACPERHNHAYYGTPRFLLWLWHRIQHDEEDQKFFGQMWSMSMDGKVDFEGSNTSSTVKSCSVDTASTSYAALNAGMVPVKMSLVLTTRGLDYSLRVGHPSDEIRSLRFPSAHDPDPAGRFEEAADVIALLDDLAAQYEAIADDPDQLTDLEARLDRWKAIWAQLVP